MLTILSLRVRRLLRGFTDDDPFFSVSFWPDYTRARGYVASVNADQRGYTIHFILFFILPRPRPIENRFGPTGFETVAFSEQVHHVGTIQRPCRITAAYRSEGNDAVRRGVMAEQQTKSKSLSAIRETRPDRRVNSIRGPTQLPNKSEDIKRVLHAANCTT